MSKFDADVRDDDCTIMHDHLEDMSSSAWWHQKVWLLHVRPGIMAGTVCIYCGKDSGLDPDIHMRDPQTGLPEKWVSRGSEADIESRDGMSPVYSGKTDIRCTHRHLYDVLEIHAS